MNTKTILSLSALVLGLAAVATPALAYQGDPTTKGPNYSPERHQINTTAFEINDYQSWLKNMTGRGATRFVNQANFKEFTQAQLAAQKGDNSLLTAFRAKYGMGQRNGQGRGQGRGLHSAAR